MNTMTLPRKGLKTRHHNKDMNERDLKKYDYAKYMDMEKEYLKKLSKGQLIKLLLKQKESKKVSNHDDLLNNDPFKDEVAQEPAKPKDDFNFDDDIFQTENTSLGKFKIVGI